MKFGKSDRTWKLAVAIDLMLEISPVELVMISLFRNQSTLLHLS